MIKKQYTLINPHELLESPPLELNPSLSELLKEYDNFEPIHPSAESCNRFSEICGGVNDIVSENTLSPIERRRHNNQALINMCQMFTIITDGKDRCRAIKTTKKD